MATLTQVSCRMAPRQNLGDTVAARYFEPADTTLTHKKARDRVDSTATDSLGLYYIGQGSTAHEVQLVSYPSRRDTAVWAKGRHLKVIGNADYGHVVRATFYITPRGDTLITRLEERQQPVSQARPAATGQTR